MSSDVINKKLSQAESKFLVEEVRKRDVCAIGSALYFWRFTPLEASKWLKQRGDKYFTPKKIIEILGRN